MGWKDLSHMDIHIAEAHPYGMNSAEKSPNFGGVCSRTCLGVQQLQVILTSGSHQDAEGGLELSKAGGAFNWIKKCCPRRCCDYTLPRNHILPSSVFPGIWFFHRISAWHWFWVLLCVAKQLFCPTSKWASLHSWKQTNPESEEGVLFTQCETLPSSLESAGVT